MSNVRILCATLVLGVAISGCSTSEPQPQPASPFNDAQKSIQDKPVAPETPKYHYVEHFKGKSPWFTSADTDKDGFLSLAEARKSLLGVAEKFEEMDGNRDKKLSYDELKAFKEYNEAAGMIRFEFADANADGKVSREEAESGGMVRALEFFSEIDGNKDGALSAEELKAWHPSADRQPAE